MTRRCDVLTSVGDRDLARRGIVEHEAGDDPYTVTEPKGYGARTLYFCSLAHLAWWLRAAVSGADKRVGGRGSIAGRHP